MMQRPNVILVVLDTARADVFEPPHFSGGLRGRTLAICGSGSRPARARYAFISHGFHSPAPPGCFQSPR